MVKCTQSISAVVLLSLAFGCVKKTKTSSSSVADANQSDSKLVVNLVGEETIVQSFDSNTCKVDLAKLKIKTDSTDFMNYIPDGPPRAYVDKNGAVRLISGHPFLYPFTGTNLEDLKMDCSDESKLVATSNLAADPRLFDDASWVWSTYVMPDRSVFALYHHETHGSSHPKSNIRCDDKNTGCWYASIAWGEATDSINFVRAGQGSHVIAHPQGEYSSQNSITSYSDPSNILYNARDGYYYITPFIRTPTEFYTCVMRSRNPKDPMDWRAFNGEGFNAVTARGEACTPVIRDQAPGSINYSKYLGKFVFTGFGRMSPEPGSAEGYFIRTSDDLVHWSDAINFYNAYNPWGENTRIAGRWMHAYPALIDPTGGLNFDELSQEPYLFFVRMRSQDPTYARQLVRVKVRFDLIKSGSKMAQAVPSAPTAPPARPAMWYKIGNDGFYNNGLQTFCALRNAAHASACGQQIDSLTSLADHGGSTPQNDPILGVYCSCGILPKGCYALENGAGLFSNGQGDSCVFTPENMLRYCGIAIDQFGSLQKRKDHGGNREGPPCQG